MGAVVESVVVLLLAWVALGIRPGPATILLAVGGGPVIDGLLTVLPTPSGWPGALAMLVVGSAMIGVGISLYVPAELGPSAQDSLFVGLYRRLGIRPGTAKFVTDAILVAVGWVLGGQVGVGTIIVTLAVPVAIDRMMPVGHRLAGTPVPGGLTFAEADGLLVALARSGRTVVGFDLVEVAPSGRPGDEWDANVGARILYRLCGLSLVTRGATD